MPRATYRSRTALRSLAFSFCAMALMTVCAPNAPGQGIGGNSFGSTPAARPAAPTAKPVRATGGLTEFATDESVEAIRIEGNKTVPAQRIIGQMQTRVGRPFDPKTLARDVRKLASLPYFVTIRPLTEKTATGRIIILEVVERSTIRYVEYLGNESISNKKLAQETGLRVGGAIDPYAVEEGRRKIQELYKTSGFGRVVVKIEEGQKSSDRGVTYVVNEGPKQRVWSVKFEGNEFATDGQLKSKIKTKPSFARLWGGKIKEEELESDVNRLTDYYRSFGFFRARVGRIIEYNDEGEWATLTFVIDEGARYEVRNVSFFGVEKFDEEQFTSLLQLTPGTLFERSKMTADLQWLKQAYGSKGYVFAYIKPETIFLEEPGKIDLIYNIEEGKRWRVGRIFVQINGEASHTRIQTALNRLSIRPGEIVDTRELQASERRLKSSSIFNANPATGSAPKISYRIPSQDGKQMASEERPTRSASRPQAHSHTAHKPPLPSVYQVQGAGGTSIEQAMSDSAPQYPQVAQYPQARQQQPTFAPPGYPTAPYGQAAAPASYGTGGVQPLGVQSLPAQCVPLPSTPPSGVVPAYKTTSAPATPPMVTPTQYLGNPLPQRPLNTALFPAQVFVPTPVPPPGDPSVDLYVNLEETQTGRFMVGAAVNSDAGLVGQILLDEQNFDWRRVPTSWQDVRDGTAFRGGGQRFRLEAAPGTLVQRYLASWQEPYLLDTPISLNLSGSFFTRRYEDWDEERVGGRIGLGYQWTENDLSASVTYRGEKVNINNAADPSVPQIAEMLGNNTLHGFGVRVVNDTRDNPFLATEGYYLSGSLEQVVGSFDYTRAEMEARTYYLLRERPDHTGRHVLVLQTRLGFTGSNTPSYDRFYAGGFGTMRGFDFRGVSPVVVSGGNGIEVGGTFRWINTVEYMFPLSADGMINGVTFCDFGTVEESVKLDNFRVAPGVGLRISVPAIGPAPIALDFAWPVSSADTDDEQVFTFNVGFQR